MKIKTSYSFPPIPFRGCDWLAYIDGDEEGPQAFGASEQEAINALNEILKENP